MVDVNVGGYDYQRKQWLDSKYGLTVEGFERLLEGQGYVCRICGEDIRGRSSTGRLRACVDHDHRTGIVRGLLCTPCNTGLGLFRDDIRLLAGAIVYLQDHQNHELEHRA